MRRLRRSPGPGNHERWLVSYADFITLMFAVFTPLSALAVVAAVKAKRLVHSIKESFGEGALDTGGRSILERALGSVVAIGETPLQTRLEETSGRIEDLALPQRFEESMTVRETERGLVITLAETLLFDSGGTTLSENTQAVLGQVADVLRKLPNHVRVEGHTDSRPPSGGPYPTNWHLSSARAVEVLLALRAGGIPGHRLSAVGFGDQRPLVSNRTAEGQRMNRRVDLVVVRVRAPTGG